MATAYEVTLEKIIQAFDLKVLALPKPPDEIFIRSSDVNRPGLQLAGFFEVFDERRTQVLGESEIVFMNRYTEEEAKIRYLEFFKANPPAVILAKGLEAPQSMVDAAKQTGIPLLTTTENTSTFISSLILFLNTELAPRLTRHGVLMEVYGEGMLIMGDSGVGKSETAVELIKRGHRLVADDAVELRKIISPAHLRHLAGQLPALPGAAGHRHLKPGVFSVWASSSPAWMWISSSTWSSGTTTRSMTAWAWRITTPIFSASRCRPSPIPVKPGRNIAVILEVAAMNYREKKLGYNAAHELLQRLGMMDIDTNWDTF